MARNGSGVYSLPGGSLVTDGTTILATQHNTPLTDLETDMNTARPVVAGGTGATTAAGARANLGFFGATGCAFHATASGTQALTAGAWRTLNFDTEQFDIGGNFAPHVFTVPTTGLYLIGGGYIYNLTGSAPTEARVGISINGADPVNYHRNNVGGNELANLDTTLSVTSLLSLTAGDEIRLKAFYETNDASTGGTNTTRFWAARLG